MVKENKEVEEHIQKHTITEFLHYPEHDAREETKEFRNAKKEMESVEHLGCYKCGTMVSRQSHHIFERAWSNGMDFRKVAYFLFNHFDFHGHCHRDFKNHEELLKYFVEHFDGKEETVEWEDEETGEKHKETYIWCDDNALDTIYNQLILCKLHHVGEGVGIHYISAPSFIAGLAEKPNFDSTVTEEDAKELLIKASHPSKFTR